MHDFRYTPFVAEYNCSTYGSGNYGLCDSTSTSSGTASDLLANTGYDVLIPLFLGVALVVAGSILLIRRRLRRRKQQTASE
jgi:hypothetical protein